MRSVCLAYTTTLNITVLGKDEQHVSLDAYIADWVEDIKDERLKRRLLYDQNSKKKKEEAAKKKQQEKKKKKEERKPEQKKGEGKGKGKEKEKKKESEDKGDEGDAVEESEGEEEEEERRGDEGGEEDAAALRKGEVVVGDNVVDVAPPPPANVDSDDAVVGKKRLHESRHEFIVQWLEKLYPNHKEPLRIADYGCGRGHLTVAMAKVLTEARFVAIDANPWAGKTKSMRSNKRISYTCGNLLFPPNPSQFTKVFAQHNVCFFFCKHTKRTQSIHISQVDVLVSCEVIEHMEQAQREQLMEIILYLIRPKHLVLTTPNIAYNPYIPNMKTLYRHPDHKIEYTREEWTREVLKPLREAGYVTTEHDLLTEEDAIVEEDGTKKPLIQPSFLVTADLKEEESLPPRKGPSIDKIAARLNADISGMQAPLFLPRNQVLLDAKKLNAGYAAMQYLQYAPEFFAAAPTIAPVDFKEPSGNEKDFLEHPESAFAYYASFGLSRVVAEKKYMGSRAQILAYR